jgi:CRP-like cAMP-binding protein
MSPARQPNGSPGRRKIARQIPIDPTLSVAAKNSRGFDPQVFLATIGEGRKSILFPKKQTIFVQGDVADAVFYVQKGTVKLTVV